MLRNDILILVSGFVVGVGVVTLNVFCLHLMFSSLLCVGTWFRPLNAVFMVASLGGSYGLMLICCVYGVVLGTHVSGFVFAFVGVESMDFLCKVLWDVQVV